MYLLPITCRITIIVRTKKDNSGRRGNFNQWANYAKKCAYKKRKKSNDLVGGVTTTVLG